MTLLLQYYVNFGLVLANKISGQFLSFLFRNLYSLEGTAHYAGLLLAPAEALAFVRGFLWGKKAVHAVCAFFNAIFVVQ